MATAVLTTQTDQMERRSSLRIAGIAGPNEASSSSSRRVDQYHFARSRARHGASVPLLQVQRIHASSKNRRAHAEPVFDMTGVNDKRSVRVSSAAVSSGQIFSIASNADVSSPVDELTDSPSDVVLYEGYHAPIAITGSTIRYSVSTYDSQAAVAQISPFGVFFSPAGTPCLMPNSSQRLSRAGVAPTGLNRRASISCPPVPQPSTCEDPQKFFLQPVALFVVVDDKSHLNFGVVDQSTNTPIGTWTRRSSKEAIWDFIYVEDSTPITLATLGYKSSGGASVSIVPDASMLVSVFMDEMIGAFRAEHVRLLRRSSISSVPVHYTVPPRGCTRARFSISALLRSQSIGSLSQSPIESLSTVAADYKLGRAVRTNGYRARFADAIMFSALSVILNYEQKELARPVAAPSRRSTSTGNPSSVSQSSSPSRTSTSTSTSGTSSSFIKSRKFHAFSSTIRKLF